MATPSTATLQGLPPELRNLIYDELAPQQSKLLVASGVPPVPLRAGPPALARSCRLFRNELLPVHYANTTFRVDVYHRLSVESMEEVLRWLVAMGRDARRRIGVIRVYGTGGASASRARHGFIKAYLDVHFKDTSPLDLPLDFDLESSCQTLIDQQCPHVSHVRDNEYDEDAGCQYSLVRIEEPSKYRDRSSDGGIEAVEQYGAATSLSR